MKLPIRSALKPKSSKKLIARFSNGEIEWSSKDLTNLKRKVRSILRHEQNETCPYCQRVIVLERRNAYEDIEHFLDKSKAHYRKYAFSAANLVLSCHACNMEKSTKDVGTALLRGGGDLRPAHRSFLWPHPYFDDLTACVRKSPGPVYEPIQGSGKEAEATMMIQDLKLDDPVNVESRHAKLVEKMNRINELCQVANRIGGERNRRRIEALLEKQQRIFAELY